MNFSFHVKLSLLCFADKYKLSSLVSQTSTNCRHLFLPDKYKLSSLVFPRQVQVIVTHFSRTSTNCHMFHRQVQLVVTSFADKYNLSSLVSQTSTDCRHLFHRQVQIVVTRFADKYRLSSLVLQQVKLVVTSFADKYNCRH